MGPRGTAGAMYQLTPTPINLSAYQSIAATPSANFAFTTNLDAGALAGATFNSSVQIYDSLGNSHTVQVTYTKTAANTWGLSATVPGAATSR